MEEKKEVNDWAEIMTKSSTTSLTRTATSIYSRVTFAVQFAPLQGTDQDHEEVATRNTFCHGSLLTH
jgi:hypothetical protein